MKNKVERRQVEVAELKTPANEKSIYLQYFIDIESSKKFCFSGFSQVFSSRQCENDRISISILSIVRIENMSHDKDYRSWNWKFLFAKFEIMPFILFSFYKKEKFEFL